MTPPNLSSCRSLAAINATSIGSLPPWRIERFAYGENTPFTQMAPEDMLAGMENAKKKAYVSAEFIKLQHGKENGMNKAIGFTERIKFGIGVALLAALTGCVGYVGPDGGVAVSGPDVVVDPGPVWIGGVWGDGDHHWEGRGDAHRFSGRGAASRGAAHSGGRGGGRR
jgi:hypothetical protein